MSAWAIEQGRRLGLTVGARLLLVALAVRADSEGYCCPGQEALSDDTGLTERGVRKLTERLVEHGLIRLEKRWRVLYYHVTRGNDMASDAERHRPSVPVRECGFGVMDDDEPTSPALSSGDIPASPALSSGQAPRLGELSSGDTGRYRNPVPVIEQPVTVDSRARTPQTLSSFNQEEEKESKLTPSVSPPCDSETTEKAPSAAAPPKSEAAPGGASTRGRQLPATWLPNAYSLSLGIELGLTEADIDAEADAMRDWAIHAGKPGKDWDRRFNNWLREEAKRRYIRKIRNQPKQTLAEEWGLKSFLLDDDELPFSERLQ